MKRHLLTILLLLLLAGCSGKPGDSELRNQVIPLLVTEDIKNYVEVKNLHKTNGYETDKNTYTVDIAYDLVFKISFAEMVQESQKAMQQTSNLTGNQSVDQFLGGMSSFFNGMGLLALKEEYGEFKAGDTFSKQDRVIFIKTENGWRLSSEPQPVLY